MTIQLNIDRAQARLAELVALAEAGEEVIIERNGKPVVTLIPRDRPAPTPSRMLGIWSEYGALADPDLFIRPDREMETLAEAPIFSEEGSLSTE